MHANSSEYQNQNCDSFTIKHATLPSLYSVRSQALNFPLYCNLSTSSLRYSNNPRDYPRLPPSNFIIRKHDSHIASKRLGDFTKIWQFLETLNSLPPSKLNYLSTGESHSIPPVPSVNSSNEKPLNTDKLPLSQRACKRSSKRSRKASPNNTTPATLPSKPAKHRRRLNVGRQNKQGASSVSISKDIERCFLSSNDGSRSQKRIKIRLLLKSSPITLSPKVALITTDNLYITGCYSSQSIKLVHRLSHSANGKQNRKAPTSVATGTQKYSQCSKQKSSHPVLRTTLIKPQICLNCLKLTNHPSKNSCRALKSKDLNARIALPANIYKPLKDHQENSSACNGPSHSKSTIINANDKNKVVCESLIFQFPIPVLSTTVLNSQDAECPQFAELVSSFKVPLTTIKLPVCLLSKSAIQKCITLRSRLQQDFNEPWLLSKFHNEVFAKRVEAIHVFVDFSNIWIGFMEYLKRVRKVPSHERIDYANNILFTSLVLILERCRPVAKRVLVGSAPAIPAFTIANQIGYETNILDKVFKMKDSISHTGEDYQCNADSSCPSNSSRNLPGGSPLAGKCQSYQKWCEQGVDELLQLKMAHSLIDWQSTATMVLATGDGAAAEFSDGFMKMVKRTLQCGWRVELVAWRATISRLYRRPNFLKQWEGKFRIIELDPYVDFLLDTE